MVPGWAEVGDGTGSPCRPRRPRIQQPHVPEPAWFTSPSLLDVMCKKEAREGEHELCLCVRRNPFGFVCRRSQGFLRAPFCCPPTKWGFPTQKGGMRPSEVQPGGFPFPKGDGLGGQQGTYEETYQHRRNNDLSCLGLSGLLLSCLFDPYAFACVCLCVSISS